MFVLFVAGLISTQTAHAQNSYQGQTNQTVISNVEQISEFVTKVAGSHLSLYSQVSPGNQADSEIQNDWINSGNSRTRLERCEWLEKNKHRYPTNAVKATEKAWGCRHSRASKDKKKK